MNSMIVALTLGHSLRYAPLASWFPESLLTFIRCSAIAVIFLVGLTLLPETAPQRRKNEYQQWQRHGRDRI